MTAETDIAAIANSGDNTPADVRAALTSVLARADAIGTFGTWSPSYTNLTVGNGTVVPRYSQANKLVIADFTFTLGSTSSIGTNPNISLPVSASSQYTFDRNAVGHVYVRDNATATYYGAVYLDSSTHMAPLLYNASGTYTTASLVTATVPMTWATGDILYMRAIYEAA